MFSSGFRIICVLSVYLSGNWRVLGSGMRELLRFTDAALLESSINLSCMALLPLGRPKANTIELDNKAKAISAELLELSLRINWKSSHI